MKACPDAFEWTRIDDGYHCKGTHHLITDELLAEGKQGVFLIGGDIMEERWGPYYESNEKIKGLFWYAGPEPRPRESTPYIGETDKAGKAWLNNTKGTKQQTKQPSQPKTFVLGSRKP
jgi:hypothetical protein